MLQVRGNREYGFVRPQQALKSSTFRFPRPTPLNSRAVWSMGSEYGRTDIPSPSELPAPPPYPSKYPQGLLRAAPFLPFPNPSPYRSQFPRPYPDGMP